MTPPLRIVCNLHGRNTAFGIAETLRRRKEQLSWNNAAYGSNLEQQKVLCGRKTFQACIDFLYLNLVLTKIQYGMVEILRI